jgi:CDP-glucose 4,6-dehydratase
MFEWRLSDMSVKLMNNFKDKRVLITGHSGFKGSWLCEILTAFGAKVYGYSLFPEETPNLFETNNIAEKTFSKFGDIRNYDELSAFYKRAKPDFVFHLAAQPIVLTSYENPVYTYETNVLGTVNILECIRQYGAESAVIITTDKVYKESDNKTAYKENAELCGFDPYANSKSCAELVTYSYKKSFLDELNIPVSTARAGNVLGGGDFTKHRLVPDCARGASSKKPIIIRNPNSVRPFQFVLEPLYGYLLIAVKQTENFAFADTYNISPPHGTENTSSEIADLFCKYYGDNSSWITTENPDINTMHEADILRLDSEKIRATLGYNDSLDIAKTVEWTAQWYKSFYNNNNSHDILTHQIEEYFCDK